MRTLLKQFANVTPIIGVTYRFYYFLTWGLR
ncbi:hypothetical protein P3T33_003984 [Rhizobium sp. AN67]|nr:hypothetical protein [Rhizobium sp. AN67]